MTENVLIMKTNYLLILLLLSASFALQAQPTEINKYVSAPFGLSVSEIDWVGTTKDMSSNLITVGNTFVSADVTAVLLVPLPDSIPVRVPFTII